MRQILQSFKSGNTELVEVPIPRVSKGSLLIRTTHTLVSLGTERMLVEFGKANIIEKARQQPDKVKMVLEKVKTDGIIPTIETVLNKLNDPLPLGYCNSGIVVDIGEGVSGFSIGDRVASNGPHAEYVCVPKNLVVKIPDGVTQAEAAFTVVGAIGLQGIRLCNPTFGETIVVFGLGLIGLLTCQMLLANGCKVIGIDIDNDKCELASSFGLQTVNPSKDINPVKAVLEYTDNIGADGVIITASAQNNEIISQSAKMSRKRGRIILVGVVGLSINRAEFFEKEILFQVSCSYGPGRYDERYEQKGEDYPLPYVRWTEKRNFETVLHSIESGSLKVKQLITDKVELKDYLQIYNNIEESKAIAAVIEYPDNESHIWEGSKTINIQNKSFKGVAGVIGVIGAGNFTKMTLLPALKKADANFKYIASSKGISGTELAKKYGFTHSTTDYFQILNDPEVDTVIITTRHDSHAKIVKDCIDAGKHVFVEKPLALNEYQLEDINEYIRKINVDPKVSLTVGFNRRFSPHIQRIKNSLSSSQDAVNLVLTMNAGFIPSEMWVHDMEIGGGRIIGEACHYIDLAVYLANSKISSVCMSAMGLNPQENSDNVSILLKFLNGSNAVINYFSNGSRSYSKERIEVYSSERTWIVDNFRISSAYGVKGQSKLRTRIDKGHRKQCYEFMQRVKNGGEPLIPLDEILNVTFASFAALQSMKEKRWVDVRKYFL